jgi:hypothetical protein
MACTARSHLFFDQLQLCHHSFCGQVYRTNNRLVVAAISNGNFLIPFSFALFLFVFI